MEHAISEEFEERIDQALGHPTVGAHGEPIPTREGEIHEPPYLRLSELKTGQQAVIRRVIDRSAEMLRYMDQIGLQLGTRVEIGTRAPFNGPLLLEVEAQREQALGLEVADHIFVEPV